MFTSNQRLELKGGDRLMVRLKKDSTRVLFERDLLVKDPLLKDRTMYGEEWVLGLPYYGTQVTGTENCLQATATLEKHTDLAPRRRRHPSTGQARVRVVGHRGRRRAATEGRARHRSAANVRAGLDHSCSGMAGERESV